MTVSNPKKYYSHFLKGHEGKLHFAAHSHHFWPDVSREGHMEYWDDCAKMSDEKWNKVFGVVIPQTQKHIASILNLKHPEQIVLAPNTHELSTRLLSVFLGRKELKILTSTNEFHSWRRQFLRLSEIPQIQIKTVSSENFLENHREFIEGIKTELQKNIDLCFLSQVFFDSGLALTDEELLEISNATPKETILVIDGYHGFGAIPTNLSKLEGKIFYLAGGYKYAQAGEGTGFMVVPKGDWRPANTGWFAEYGSLTKPAGAQVGYTQDAMAFMGATQDPSGAYRFNAVWNEFNKDDLNVEKIHQYIKNLQKIYLEKLPQDFLKNNKLRPIFKTDLLWHGHFLTFETQTQEEAEVVQEKLKKAGILIDRRGSRLRFGFGLYHDEQDILSLCEKLKQIS